MEEEQKQLLPCPFCGKEPKLKEAPNHMDIICYWVRCVNVKCVATVGTYHEGSPKKAVKSWNTRAQIVNT